MPARLADVAAADVEVVLLDCFDHVGERQVVLDEPLGIDADLILLLVSAPTVDLGGTADSAHLRPDDPILDRAQLGSVGPLPGHDVVKDFAQARCDRSHLRPHDPGGISTAARRSLMTWRAK